MASLAAACSLVTGSAFAQGAAPRFLVSTSSPAVPDSGPLGAFDDAALVVVAAGEQALPWHLEGHWRALSALVPDDVDGIAIVPGYAALEHRGLCFSMLSDAGGFKDGDVVMFGDGGQPVLYVAEEILVQGLGLTGTALDVDGLAFDGSGRMLFSLQNDVQSPLLGPVADGDVLRLESGGVVTRAATEADVQIAYTAATGSVTAIGDVQGIEWHAGELWVAIQSPTAADGGILRVTPAPDFVVQEAALGLGGAELNALLRLPDGDVPFTAWLEPGLGSTWQGYVAGGTPGGLIGVFACGQPGFLPGQPAIGFGAWYFDLLDPLLLSQALAGGPALIALDGQGRASHPFMPTPVGAAPGFGGELGVTLQALDFGTLRVSPPFRVVL